SVPGRYLVLTPRVARVAVSKKIEDPGDRDELRRLIAELDPPDGLGFIIRTAGSDRSHRDLRADLDVLLETWEGISARARAARPPALVFQESNLALRAIRDIYTPDIEEVWVDCAPVYDATLEFFRLSMPRAAGRVRLYREPTPIFHRFAVEHQIETIFHRRVDLPNGGYVVIDSTEALVAIDVNSGRFTRGSPEEMAFSTNMEAAREIIRQLRLRDLGGQIVLDFIDMKEARHRQELENRLRAELRKDRAKSTLLRMSRLGLLEMAREKLGSGVKLLAYESCPHCKGTGLVKTVESMSLQVLRQLRLHLASSGVSTVDARVHPEVATYLANGKRRELNDLEDRFNVWITVRAVPELRLEDAEIASYDAQKQRIK
ncbi:MAG: Rne/Rng family ribonuclease, partial [Planctomycetes bacterium]|nr:Rne/Rng family ribonuclease [Planctomycetota bacterium]